MSLLPRQGNWTEELTSSNHRFWGEKERETFRKTHFLIAGCGSIGNPIAEMAVMMGSENITVADPDTVELSNLSRQRYGFWQIGRNKAHMTALNLRLINPVSPTKEKEETESLVYSVTDMEDISGIRSIKEGITLENVDKLVKKSDFIVDAIDIRALDIIFALHESAAYHKKPVIVGYDMAGTAMIAVYRYDLEDIKPLNGDLTKVDIELFNKMRFALKEVKISDAEFMNFIYDMFTGPVNPLHVPVEQFLEILTKENDGVTPQSGTTATALSALAIEVAKKIINGEDVKRVVHTDLPSLIREQNPSIIARLILMARTLKVMRNRAQTVRNNIKSINSN